MAKARSINDLLTQALRLGLEIAMNETDFSPMGFQFINSCSKRIVNIFFTISADMKDQTSSFHHGVQTSE